MDTLLQHLGTSHARSASFDSPNTREVHHLSLLIADVSRNCFPATPDGSFVQDYTGYVFVYEDQVFSIRLQCYNSVYMAELCAK